MGSTSVAAPTSCSDSWRDQPDDVTVRSRAPDGMVNGMATKKVTVTLGVDQLDRVRMLVESGTAASVSGFVQHAVSVALDDVAGWGAMLAEALHGTGGELSSEERRWADDTLAERRHTTPAA